DYAMYDLATAAITINLANTKLNTGDAAGDTYFSIEVFSGTKFNDKFIGDDGDNLFTGGAGNDTLDGGKGNDILDGGDGNDVVTGGDGNDLLEGELGDDRLIGGAGNDSFIGGGGNDIADYTAVLTGMTFVLSNTANSTGEAKGDTYDSIEI